MKSEPGWRVALTTLFLSTGAPALASEAARAAAERQGFPLVVAGLHEAVGVPFSASGFSGPAHPGMSIGSEYEHARGKLGRLFQTANLGFFNHARLDRVVFVGSELGYGVPLDFGLGFEALLGVAYGHSFTDRQLYSVHTGEAAPNWGKPTMLVSLGMGTEFDLRAVDLAPVTIFVRYQPLMQARFNPANSLPLVPRTVSSVGIKLHFDELRGR